MMKRLLVALSLLISAPAFAQWQIPTNTIPVGLGAGVIGFGHTTAVNSAVLSTNPSGVPDFSTTLPTGLVMLGAASLSVKNGSIYSFDAEITGSPLVPWATFGTSGYRGGTVSIVSSMNQSTGPGTALQITPTATSSSNTTIFGFLQIQQVDSTKLTSPTYINGLYIALTAGNAPGNQNAGIISFMSTKAGADAFGADMHGLIDSGATAAPSHLIGAQGTVELNSATYVPSQFGVAVIGTVESSASKKATSVFAATTSTSAGALFILTTVGTSPMTDEGIVLVPANDSNPGYRAFGIVNAANNVNTASILKSGAVSFASGNFAVDANGNVNTKNISSGTQIGAPIVLLLGATSGSVTLAVPSIAGSNTITFPAGTTNFSATGGTSQVVKQTTSGGAFTVARLACADLSDSAAGCTNAGANPTASLGLTAVNGSATTYMRSDAAPALSQAITPTWTGTHTFSNSTYSALFTGGYVGIGTTVPNSPLQVSNTTLIAPTLTWHTQAAFAFENSSAGELAGAFTTAGAYFWLQARGGSNNGIPVILNPISGNVGINTTTAVTNLNVSGTSAAVSLSANNGIFSVDSSIGIQLQFGSALAAPNGGWIQVKNSNLNGSTTYPLVLNPLGGNVGIGTLGPGQILDVVGNILSRGHLLATGTAPTISSCGVSPSISGSDTFGTVTAGTGILSSCVITFGTTWGAAPRCVASSGTAIASMTVTTTTTQLTIGGTSLTGDTINWICGSTSFLMERDLNPANDNEPAFMSRAA